MKKLFSLILIIIITIFTGCMNNEIEIYRIKTGLKKLDTIGSSIVGAGASEHQFHKYYQELKEIGQKSDYHNFLSNKNSIVKAMGIYCLANTLSYAEAQSILNKYIDDDTQVVLLRYGCISETITLGDFTLESLVNKDFLTIKMQ